MFVYFFFFKQKTAYEMRISDWSSDVCSSDLSGQILLERRNGGEHGGRRRHGDGEGRADPDGLEGGHRRQPTGDPRPHERGAPAADRRSRQEGRAGALPAGGVQPAVLLSEPGRQVVCRSDENTSELQALMRISYAVLCLQKK